MERTIDVSNFMTLPYMAQYEILMKIQYRDLMQFCATSRQARRICDDEDFWKFKIQRDFGRVGPASPAKYEGEAASDLYPVATNIKNLHLMHSDTWKAEYEYYLKKVNKMFETVIFEGNLDAVIDLIDVGADVNHNNGYPMNLAVGEREPDIVKVLLENGADPNLFEDVPLIYVAVQNSDINMVEILIEAGTDVDTLRTPRHGYDPDALGMATRRGDEAMSSLLRRASGKWRSSTFSLIDEVLFNIQYFSPAERQTAIDYIRETFHLT